MLNHSGSVSSPEGLQYIRSLSPASQSTKFAGVAPLHRGVGQEWGVFALAEVGLDEHSWGSHSEEMWKGLTGGVGGADDVGVGDGNY